jgi:uncharacterized protein (DUF58 family)
MEIAALHQRMKAVAAVARLPLRAGLWSAVNGSVMGQGTGNSIDFQDQRPYLPGDDPRHINWQAYARTGHYTMKLYRQEVTPRVDVIFDFSGSMFLSEAKATRTWELLYFCMESALRLGASLKLHVLRDKAREMPLEQALAHDWPAPEGNDGRDFASLLQSVPTRAGSLRVLLSDLLFESAPEQLTSQLTTGRGRALVLAPFCQEESQPDWSGNVEFENVETTARDKRRVEREVLGRYLQAYATHFMLWREQCARRGLLFARVACEPEMLQSLRGEAVRNGAVEMT